MCPAISDCPLDSMNTKQSLPSITTTMQRNDFLAMVPTEIVLHIFCQFASLSDVLALSTVSRRFRDLWLNSANLIYMKIAPRIIPCVHAARRFLADQGGPDLASPLVAKDVIRTVRNADIVENAILELEREIVSRVESKFVLIDG